jgi:hypothetical protein
MMGITGAAHTAASADRASRSATPPVDVNT